MCNPRRITVRATREFSRAWQATISRTARRRGEVRGRARLSRPLGSLLGDRARRAFESAVNRDTRWELREGAYHLSVPGGQAVYRPQTGHLEITVELAEVVEVQASAEREARGVVTESATSTAESTYYGRGRRQAEESARSTAETEAARLARERAEAGRRDEAARGERRLEREADQVQDEADERADQRLEQEGSKRQAALVGQAEARLEDIQQETLRGVWQTVAQGYRDALLAYAQENGAQDLRVSEDEDGIHLQFEMEV